MLAAPTNETVARLNHAAQRRRIDAGDLNPRGRHVDANGYRFHAGDEIATRRNDRQLHTDQGLTMIRNRDQWTIATVHRNGDLTVTGRTGTTRLPAHYVEAHVELAYAQTSHATQGRTVDRSILVLDAATDVRGIYVPMTRGRHHNDAYIVTTGEQSALDVFADSISRSPGSTNPPTPAKAELASHNPYRPGTLAPNILRDLLDEQARLTATLKDLNDDSRDPAWRVPTHPHPAREAPEADLDQASSNGSRERSIPSARYDKPLRRRGNEAKIV